MRSSLSSRSGLSPTGGSSPAVRRVRKRVSVGAYAESLVDFSGRLDPDDSKSVKSTPGMKVWNFLISIAVVSFPIGIFMLPLLLRTSSYPRIVVSLSTIPERLPHIQPALESLLYKQSLPPDTVYLVLPKQDFYTKKPINYEPWPDFLHEMMTTSNKLEILQPAYDYGPASKILNALEQEANIQRKKQQQLEQHSKRQDSSLSVASKNTITGNTRIVYLDDDIQYHTNLVRVLVDASLEAEEESVNGGDVVALSGAILRNNFRQIKHYDPKASYDNDKPPNLYLYLSGKRSEWQQVDIVQGFTAVCIPIITNEGLEEEEEVEEEQAVAAPDVSVTVTDSSSNNVALSSVNTEDMIQMIYTILKDPSIPEQVVKSDDIILSAVMEHQNMTRWIVPDGGVRVQYTNSSKIKALSKGTMNNANTKSWMEAVYYMQQKLQIWQEYHFLNLKLLTPEQLEAIDCEAKHEQDCSGTVCWPNPTECPEAKDILKELTWGEDEEP